MSSKRHLSLCEIQEITDFIFDGKENMRTASGINRLDKIKSQIVRQLEAIIVYPQTISSLKNILRNKVWTSFVEAGSSVGVICAQSIGEKQTQMTLNTFHAAGITVETVVTGVPRFLELLNASKEPKLSSSKGVISKTHFQNKDQLRRYLYKNVMELTFSQFCADFDFSNRQGTIPPWYFLYLKLFLNHREKEIVMNNHKYICIRLNYENLFRFHVKALDIVEQIKNNLDLPITCVISPVDIGEIHIYYDNNTCSYENTNEYDSDDEISNEMDINLDCSSSDISMLIINKLQNLVLYGIPNIKDFFIEEKDEYYIIHTKGNNYTKIMCLDIIDSNQTISNNMWNILSVLGIEAAREFLISEFSSIIASDGAYVNSCHVHLLVDIMTFSGTIVSVSRYGMKNDQFGAMAKASFEESLDNFLKASIFAENERTTDVSASIICGKRSNIGSGLCEMLLDISQMF